jgi:arginase family enzyme
MEINPKADHSGATSRLMATMLWRFLATRLRSAE